ncbi:MAG: hypothetical protein ACM3SO_15120 [Betaproteobacteria bacterium]
MTKNPLKHALAALACVIACAAPAHAASVLPLYLEEMIDTASVAFEGTCIGNRSERDPATNLVVTYTTFQVRDVLKGTVAATHVIKQVGGTLPDGGMQYRVAGVPTFAPGEDYVVFLAGVSSAGFSSPIGLAQGRFSVKPGQRVGNGRDFREMATHVGPHMPASARAALANAQGPVRDMDLLEFKQTVRNRVAVTQ